MERTTMVRNVRVLEKHEIIKLTSGSGKTYALSDKGKQAMDIAVPIWNKTQLRIEEYLGKEDADALLRISCKLQNLS